jgi:hypothetical protein
MSDTSLKPQAILNRVFDAENNALRVTGSGSFVSKSGDTMSGDLYIKLGNTSPYVPNGGGIVLEPYNGTLGGGQDNLAYARYMWNPEKKVVSPSNPPDVILSAHKYHEDGSVHQHLSLYTSDASGVPQHRIDVQYLKDIVDINFTNAQVIMAGDLPANTANFRGLIVSPTFTGSGAGAAGIEAHPTHEPSASVSAAYGFINIAKGNPDTGIGITTLYGGYNRVDTGSLAGTVTKAIGSNVANPSLGSIKPTTIVGQNIENQGESGATTSIGIDIAAQTGSATNIGVRIAKGDTYALQLSDTGGTAAGGVTFGTDVTLYRSGANVLKSDDTFDANAYKVAGVAGATGSFTTTDGKTVTVTNGIITAIV